MNLKPKLLFLAHLLPYPPDSGAAIRTYNVLKLLARAFDITALCFYRNDPARRLSLQDRLTGFRGLCRVRAFPIPQQGNRARLLTDHLRSLVSGQPYTRYLYESAEYRQAVEAAVGEFQPALIHLDSLDLLGYLSDLPSSIPLVCTHHNVESQLLRRRAAGEPRPFRRAYLQLQAGNLERAERRWMPRMALNIAVSDADAAELRRLAPDARVVSVPNGVDTDFFRPFPPAPARGLVFTGGTDWWPNRDALQWFARDILPLLRAEGLEAPVTWVGHAMEADRLRYQAQDITLTGYVDDIRPAVAAASCFIVPLRIGGGTRLKILNAWAMGKAVVSTAIGAEGLRNRPGENILLADTARDFARAVASVLRNEELRGRLGLEGRRTVEGHYSWDHLSVQMTALYRDLLQMPDGLSGSGGG